MKKILMLSQTVFPPDIRLEKEIATLVAAGHSVHVLCNQYIKDDGIDFPLCSITRIKALFRSTKLNKILNFPFFLSPRYLIIAFIAYIKYKPDIIHAHDLPMVPLALIIKFFSRRSVVYDMHENYPEALRFFEKKGLINFVFKNYRLARILDRYCLRKADRLIVVIEENKERLITLKINPEKIFLVSNTIDLNYFKEEVISNHLKENYNGYKIILYTGTIGPERGLDTPIKAMKYLSSSLKNVKLLIVGDGPKLPDLKRLAEELKVNSFVEFIKWPGRHKLPLYWNLADICTIPQPYNDFINTTIPNKLYEYMFFRKPVLTSDAIPLKRIITETDTGEVFRSNDPQDFALKAIQIFSNNKNYGINGYNAIKKKYNWTIDAEQLIKLYSTL